MQHSYRHIAAALLLFALLAPIAFASSSSPAELLEQAIYKEETVGDLTSAMEIYQRVLDDAEANRPHIAQAQFRLGICHLKRSEGDEARSAFETLIRDYPEEERLVAAAREELSTLNAVPTLGSAPWKDGEQLVYRISLANGKELGFLRRTTRSDVVDGRDVWQFDTRRFIFSGADDYGISRVTVEKETQRPVRSSFRSRSLGNSDALYGVDSVKIMAQNAEGPEDRQTILEKTAGVFDNEQIIALMRTLPLEPGFEFSFRILPIWTEAIIDAKVTVSGREACEVPAGSFTCDVLDLSIHGQQLWYSTGSERKMVKMKAGGAVLELAEIRQVGPEGPSPYSIDELGFTGTLPAGWMSHNYQPREGKGVIRLLDPDAVSLSSIEIDRCPRKGCPGLEEMAKHELSGAERRFTDFTLRQETWRERTIDERPAISFISDYKNDDESWVQYRIYTFSDDTRFEYIFRLPADQLDAFKPAADSIIDSLRVR